MTSPPAVTAHVTSENYRYFVLVIFSDILIIELLFLILHFVLQPARCISWPLSPHLALSLLTLFLPEYPFLSYVHIQILYPPIPCMAPTSSSSPPARCRLPCQRALSRHAARGSNCCPHSVLVWEQQKADVCLGRLCVLCLAWPSCCIEQLLGECRLMKESDWSGTILIVSYFLSVTAVCC